MFTFEIALVVGILAVAVILFVSERLPVDIVALLVLVSLALTGLVSPAEALSGFSNSAVVTVWAVLILSGALSRTGIAALIGSRVMRFAGQGETRLLVIIMFSVGVLSGFMNSIGVASLFLPVVIDIAHQTRRSPSKLLMPLSFAALMGGLVTLIGTPPNILVSEALLQAGLKPFGMFDFTPIGLMILVAGIAYMALLGRRLLPARDITQSVMADSVQPDTRPRTEGANRANVSQAVTDLYDLQERMFILHVPPTSALEGRTLAQSRLGAALGLNVIAIFRGGEIQLAPTAETRLQAGDRILVEGELDRLSDLRGQRYLVLERDQEQALSIESLVSSEIQVAEIQLLDRATVVGQTLLQAGFRRTYGVNVLAVRRGETVWQTNLRLITLQAGDVLLVQGSHQQIEQLRDAPDFLLSVPETTDLYNLEESLMIVGVPPESSLVGKSLVESRLSDAYGLSVLGIVRAGETHLMPNPEEGLFAGDTLLVRGKAENLRTVEGLQQLEVESDKPLDVSRLESEKIGLVEAVLSPHTTLAGKTLTELHFRAKYGLNVLAIWREGRAYRSKLRDMALRFGDALLLYGAREKLRMLGSEPDFIVLTGEAQEPARLNKAPLSLLIMAGVLVPVILGWVNIAIAVVAGVVLMVVSGCITMEEAYRAVQLRAIFLIAGMLPLGIALESTGAANLIAEGMVGLIGRFGPLAVTAGLFLLSTFASQVMPNPAVVVLLAPIALNAAANLGVSPYPLMMAVAISASAAFLSPVGHPANVLVMGPGGYRFGDYTRVGLPLSLVVFVIVMLALPFLWPF